MTNGKDGSARAWEVLFKIMVPVSMLAGAAMIRNEVVDGRQDEAIHRNKEDIDEGPPKWLQDAVLRIESAQSKTNDKLEKMAERMTRIEAKVK